MASVKALAAIALILMIAAPIGLGYLFATHNVPYDEWQVDSTQNVTENLLNHESPTYIDYVGTTNNTQLESGRPLDYVSVSTNPTSYPVTGVSSTVVDLAAGAQYDVSSYGDFSVSWRSSAMLLVNRPGSSTAIPSSGMNVTTTVELTGEAGMTISFNADTTATIRVYSASGDDYADVSDGWKLPTETETWINNQTNSSMLFSVYLPDDSWIRIENRVTIRNTAGVVELSQYSAVPNPDLLRETLGNYTYLQILVNKEGVTLYGLDAWPRMDRTPVSYNQVSVPWISRSIEDFTSVRFNITNIDTIFRVDRATILSGTFPDTLDATLSMNNLFPGRSYDLRLNSIGVYGDSITLAGQSYEVNLGRIVVDGHTVPLRGSVISSHRSGDHFVNAINGIALDNTALPASVFFGGEWSLTATAALMVEVQGERTEWNPGQFAFNKQDFAAVGLLVAGACLVGLGMWGQRSGAKIGLLLLICGGAAIGYLIII